MNINAERIDVDGNIDFFFKYPDIMKLSVDNQKYD